MQTTMVAAAKPKPTPELEEKRKRMLEVPWLAVLMRSLFTLLSALFENCRNVAD